MFFKKSAQCVQNSQENTFTRDSFLNKVAGLRSATLFKKIFWHRKVPNIVKKESLFMSILRYFKEHLFTEHFQMTASLITLTGKE